MFNLLKSGSFVVENVKNTRSHHTANPIFQRLTLTQHAFSYKGPTEWNSLPIRLRSIPKFNVFKRALKRYFLDAYHNS